MNRMSGKRSVRRRSVRGGKRMSGRMNGRRGVKGTMNEMMSVRRSGKRNARMRGGRRRDG